MATLGFHPGNLVPESNHPAILLLLRHIPASIPPFLLHTDPSSADYLKWLHQVIDRGLGQSVKLCPCWRAGKLAGLGRPTTCVQDVGEARAGRRAPAVVGSCALEPRPLRDPEQGPEGTQGCWFRSLPSLSGRSQSLPFF